MTTHNQNKNKIGILGGTFNPIHFGHLILAQNALECCQLDKVLIMPSGVSYFKDPRIIADTFHRINMTKLAIEDNPCFELSTIETEREGNSYTFETLEYLLNANKSDEYYYIIGADTLFSIETWKEPQIIFSDCTIVCAVRNNIDAKELIAKSEFLKAEYKAKIILLDSPEIEISSTQIRDMLKEGRSCKYYIPEKELEYIKENNLFI